MSIRPIKTAISTIRSVYDENGNYLPTGNYFFRIKDYDQPFFTGNISHNDESFGEFCFSPKKLVKMLAVGQSRLARRADMHHIRGMPGYPSPLNSPPVVRRYNANSFMSRYVVNGISRNTTIRNREEVQCSICMEMIDRTEKKTLNCNHDFHTECVNRWLRSNDTCPLCRAPQRVREPERQTISSRYAFSEDPFTREIERLQRDYRTGRINFNIPSSSRLSHQ